MPKHLNGRGELVAADDPSRLIWYGICTYWTDDWEKRSTGGIPCCPRCGRPGFQITAESWFENEGGNPPEVEA